MHLSPRLKKEEPEQPGIPTPKLVRKKKIGGKDEKVEDKRKITQEIKEIALILRVTITCI